MNILIVDSANKGRSTALCVYLKYLIKQNNISGLFFDSAGANERAIKKFKKAGNINAGSEIIEKLNKEGINEINDHKIKAISKSLLEKNDLILVVNRKNKEIILERFPEFDNKIFLIKRFVGINSENLDITDAHYHGKGNIMYDRSIKKNSPEAFEKMLAEIKFLAEKILDKIE